MSEANLLFPKVARRELQNPPIELIIAQEEPFESIIQVLGEIYVTGGAIETADRHNDGQIQFRHEPGIANSKNPEFEVSASETWYSVEVKTPRLIEYGRKRAVLSRQLTARLPHPSALGPATLPRDNPIKDFLVSANEKFAAYRAIRPDALAILTIVWDDFIQEAVSALCHPKSGLLTAHSFFKGTDGKAVQFENVDAVLLIRHQHQMILATREEPLGDGQRPFTYHGPPFPPKALVLNPAGRAIPPEVVTALGATPIEDLSNYAEYRAPDMIIWVGGVDQGEDSNTD